MNTLASQIALPFGELKFARRERERIAQLDTDPAKAGEAREARDRLLDRHNGRLENSYFCGIFTRTHTPEERRIALETRRRRDLKDQIILELFEWLFHN